MTDNQGEKLKKLFKLRDISVADAAEKLGVSRQTVYQYFNSTTLSIDVVNNITDKLGIAEGDLWGAYVRPELSDSTIESSLKKIIELKDLLIAAQKEHIEELQERITELKERLEGKSK